MPGYLIPADLDRMIPAGANPFEWAETNLLASPGAVVMKDGDYFRIPTLVPAVKADGTCIHLTGGKRNGRCDIHETAPFGCAFFSCRTVGMGLSDQGLQAVAFSDEHGLYKVLWLYLWELGNRQQPPEVLRQRMKNAK
jgi:hypothetical protein